MAVEVDKEEKSSVKRPVAEEDNPASSSCGGNGKRGLSGKGAKGNANASTNNNYDEEEMNVEPELRTLNKTKHNWRSNKQYALTKVAAHKDKASLVVCHWLFKRYPGTKTYSIVGSVSIPTYKKCYAGAIFEFSENNGTPRKKVLYHV